jgi:hypothetical protein
MNHGLGNLEGASARLLSFGNFALDGQRCPYSLTHQIHLTCFEANNKRSNQSNDLKPRLN